MDPILFSIGGLHVYTHGLLIALGCLLGGLLVFWLARKQNLPTKYLFEIIVFSLFFGIIGSRIVYIILYYYQFQNWYDMFLIWYGGLVSFGGIAFGLIAAWLMLKKRGQNVLKWFDLGVIGLMFGWGVGRIGCFLTNDTPGVVANNWLAINNQVPVALIEAVSSFLITGILIGIYFMGQKGILKIQDGFIFVFGITSYALARFITDFWRDENIIYLLRGGQLFSLLIIICVAVVLIYKYYQTNHSQTNQIPKV